MTRELVKIKYIADILIANGFNSVERVAALLAYEFKV
jgi:hypothetical protein